MVESEEYTDGYGIPLLFEDAVREKNRQTRSHSYVDSVTTTGNIGGFFIYPGPNAYDPHSFPLQWTVTTTEMGPLLKVKRGRSVFYGGAEMQGYSMGEYNLYEVAAIVLPSKKGDFEGEGAKVLTFGPEKALVTLVVAPNDDGAIMRASKLINEEYDVNRLKVFVRPFVAEE
jgi:hypothetical protein